MNGAERRWALLLLFAIASSRLLLIPGVPWEQDEALFAAAAFDTNIVEHRPHPPGFPGWVAVAKAGLAATGDPVAALQAVSALASTAAAWLLATALVPVLGARLALAAAAWWAFLPGVWFHAPRAFSSTPATALTLGAVAVWCRPGRYRWYAGTALLAAALLVRPALAPPIAALALAAAWLRRERPGAIAAATGLAAVVLAAGFAPLVTDSGGLGPFLRALREHGSHHGGALGLAPWRFADLGPVRAAGGPAFAVPLALLAVVGVPSLGRRRSLAWLAVTGATLAWLLLAHNRTYPRYAVPAMALLVPAAVAGLQRLLPRAAPVLAAAAAAAAAARGAPAVVAQAEAGFPPLKVLAQASSSGFVVVDGALSPFGDLLNLARRTPQRVVWRPLVAEGRIPLTTLNGQPAFVWADPTPRRWVAPPLGAAATVTAPANISMLAQDRYLTAYLGLGGAVVLKPDRAHVSPDRGLMLQRPVELLVPPAGTGDRLLLALEADVPATIRLQRADGPGAITRRVPRGRSSLAVRLPAIPHAWRLRAGANGEAVWLRRLWIEDARTGYGDLVVPARELAAGGLDGLVNTSGLWGVERLGDPPREARWTAGTARLALPLAPGTATVELAAPRPEPAEVTLRVPPGGPPVRVEVGPRWQRVPVPVPDRHRRVLEIRVTNPFVPMRFDPQSRDGRELGVAVGTVEVGVTSPRP